MEACRRTLSVVRALKTIIKKAFSPMEVAKMLGVSHATIYREMNRGRLNSVKVGTRRVITQWDLEEYLGKERARALLEDVSNEEATQRSEAAEQDRLARIDAAMGMFAHLPGSLDGFMKEKQRDINIEDRHFENRGQK
jgi:excisionase family DNA binding protein